MKKNKSKGLLGGVIGLIIGLAVGSAITFAFWRIEEEGADYYDGLDDDLNSELDYDDDDADDASGVT